MPWRNTLPNRNVLIMVLFGNNISIIVVENGELFHKLLDAIKYVFHMSSPHTFRFSISVRMRFIQRNLHPHWKRKISLWICWSKSKYCNHGIQYNLRGNHSLSRLSSDLWFSGSFRSIVFSLAIRLIAGMPFRMIFNVHPSNMFITNRSILKSSPIISVKNTRAMIYQFCQIEQVDCIWNQNIYFFACFFFSLFEM